MIFILLVLALVVCFYAYAFVNFQKEIAGIRRRKLLGAVTIPLRVPQGHENEPEQSSTAVMEVASDAGDANLRSRRAPVQPISGWKHPSSKEFYQVESPYLGPLFLVPRRNERVNRRARAAHARLVSAMCGAAPGAVHQKSAADYSRAESDSGNVIRINPPVSAQS